jgi:hypothetical protein
MNGHREDFDSTDLATDHDVAYAEAEAAALKAREEWRAEFRARYLDDHPLATEAEIDQALADEIEAHDDDDSGQP